MPPNPLVHILSTPCIFNPNNVKGQQIAPNTGEDGEGLIIPRSEDVFPKLKMQVEKCRNAVIVTGGESQIQEEKPLEDDSASPHKLILNSNNGEQKVITKLKDMTVQQLKMQVLEMFPYTGPVEDVRLIHKGIPLDKDSAWLSDYNINHMSVVQVVKKVSGG